MNIYNVYTQVVWDNVCCLKDAKNPHISAKEPYISTIERYILYIFTLIFNVCAHRWYGTMYDASKTVKL